MMLFKRKDSLLEKGFDSVGNVAEVFLNVPNFDDLVQQVVDSVFREVSKLGSDFHITVLALVQGDYLKRITMSRTEEAHNVRSASDTAFEEIVTPLDAEKNACVRAIKDQQPYLTHNYVHILKPPFSEEKCIRLQKAGGIQTMVVFPVIIKNKPIGVMIFSTKRYIDELSKEEMKIIETLTGIVGIAVENARLFNQVERDRKELERANNKLQELDKLKDEFVSIASHELRTPMVSIKNYIWMTLAGKGGKLRRKQKFYLDRAYASAKRMSKLINDLLNISRIESGRIMLSVDKEDISQLIEQIVDEFKPRAKNFSVEVVIECPVSEDKKHGKGGGLPEVIIDKDKIAEVLTNLIGNALKFSPKDSKVRVCLSNTAKFVRVEVIDEGVGLTKDQIPKLFKKFGMLKESYSSQGDAAQGTGLGLYISKSIIELHGGEIGVKSAGHSKGSTFFFTVPVYTENKLKKLQKKFDGATDAGIIRTNQQVEEEVDQILKDDQAGQAVDSEASKKRRKKSKSLKKIDSEEEK